MGGQRRPGRQLSPGLTRLAESNDSGAAPRWRLVAGIVNLRVTLAQPWEEVAALVELAAEGIRLDAVSLWVKNCSRAFAGRAYLEERYCVVRIGRGAEFPIRGHRYPRLKTAPVYDINSWQEALVIVTAHELRHQDQFHHRVSAGEIDAERWALGRLEAYRSAKGEGR